MNTHKIFMKTHIVQQQNKITRQYQRTHNKFKLQRGRWNLSMMIISYKLENRTTKRENFNKSLKKSSQTLRPFAI